MFDKILPILGNQVDKHLANFDTGCLFHSTVLEGGRKARGRSLLFKTENIQLTCVAKLCTHVDQ